MWSQAYGRVGRGGEAGEQQEPSLPLVSKFTNHIRLKFDTRSLVEREKIFLLKVPQLPKHWSFSFPPSQKYITPGTCFFLLLPVFSQGITMGQEGAHFSWLP